MKQNILVALDKTVNENLSKGKQDKTVKLVASCLENILYNMIEYEYVDTLSQNNQANEWNPSHEIL